MPKRDNYEFDYQEDINQMIDKIDIDEYFFDSSQERGNESENTGKRSKSPLGLIRSPLVSEQNISQAQSHHQTTPSCSQQIPIIYNEQKNAQNNADNFLKSTTVFQKSEKNKLYAKNYREKKKQRLSVLQQENRFLKSKIDDLSFRLKQAQIELNKYKHNHESNTKNYQTARQSLLKEIQNILQKQQQNIQKMLQLQKKLKKINAFDSKHRMDLLNYFMSELLENLLTDMDFYFADSLIEKKGIWKMSDSVSLTKIDMEVKEIIGRDHWERTRAMIDGLPAMVMQHFINFKTLWKNLYQDYLNIINQGTLIETLCKQLEEHDPQHLHQQVHNCLKLVLYFQKIKYRKDLRQLRQSWFQEQQNKQKLNNNKLSKKIKLIH